MDPTETKPDSEGSGRGRWLMIACCVPIVVIAVLLVAFGAPLGTLAVVAGCVAMVGLMMLAMR